MSRCAGASLPQHGPPDHHLAHRCKSHAPPAARVLWLPAAAAVPPAVPGVLVRWSRQPSHTAEGAECPEWNAPVLFQYPAPVESPWHPVFQMTSAAKKRNWMSTLAPPDMISSWWLWLNYTVFTWHPFGKPCSTPDDLQLMDVTECDSLYLTSLRQPLLHQVWSPVDGCD